MMTTCNTSIRIRDLKDEVLQDYKKVSMLISVSFCDFKCCKELGNNICQNSSLVKQDIITISYEKIYTRYINNQLTHAIIIAGLEPMMQIDEVIGLIQYIRDKKCDDDIIIYTGYYKEEIENEIEMLKKYKNIIVKFGRFIPDFGSYSDPVLGITLSSKNQFAEKIS